MQYSIVAFSEIARNADLRIDAECYTPYHLEVERAISKKNFNLVEDYAASVINFGPYSLCNYIEFLDSGKPFLVTEDINNNVIETGKLRYISEEVHLLLHKSHCFKGQVLLTMAGAYLGQAAVFNEDFECSSNQAIAKITLKSNSINPYYMSTFLNCRYGQSQIERFRTGTGQPNLNLGLIKTIKVVEASNHFQGAIDKGVNTALELRREGVNIYEEAQTLLLSEIGLDSWQPQHRLTFVKNYSNTKQAGRIDAEYYQPKYEKIGEVLVKLNAKPIRSYEFLSVTTGQYCPDYVSSDEGRPYLRGTDCTMGSIDIDNLFYIKPEDQILGKQAQEGDVVVTRVGTIGLSARIPEECDGGTISDNLIRVRILDGSKIDSYYLSCFLGSEIGKSLMLKNARGSVQQRLNQETLKEIMLPIPEMEVQSKIKDKIIESFNLRKQSRHLLECAKRAVEIAIEQNEQTAIDYLENTTQIQD